MTNNLLQKSANLFHTHKVWVTQIAIVLVVTLLAFLLAYVLISVLNARHAKAVARRKAEHQAQDREYHPTLGIWGWGFFEALKAPLYGAIWVVGLIYSLEIAEAHFQAVDLFQFLENCRTVVLILLFFWFLQRFITYTSKRALSMTGKHKPDVTTVYALTKVGRLLSWVIVALVVLQAFGVPLSGVVAFGGGSAIIVGIAAKDLLANFFGGWVVIMDKPFKVGDWICSPDKSIEGTVEYVGWRSTRIRTFDKRPLYVPNAAFTTIAIENPSRMLNRRIKQVVGVRYDDVNKVVDLSKAIEDMLKSHPDIDQTQTTFVSLINFGEYSLDLLVYTFTKTTAWVEFQKIQEDVMVKMLNIIEDHGAESPFPTKSVVFPEGLAQGNLSSAV